MTPENVKSSIIVSEKNDLSAMKSNQKQLTERSSPMKINYAVNKNIMIIECDSRLLSESRNGASSALQYSEPTSGSAIGG